MKNTATTRIEQDYPGWLVWLSARGEHWGAVRRDMKSDLPRTIIADSEDELREALAREPVSAEPST
ncbi:hypothetical protein [Spirillospora albida]|uniref:hypothetical protein n=1 Tax=Spirillospora albida TaxID=58123 RepID=UPI0004C03A64|nr:hypothetical protein [Spirillospora albida]